MYAQDAVGVSVLTVHCARRSRGLQTVVAGRCTRGSPAELWRVVWTWHGYTDVRTIVLFTCVGSVRTIAVATAKWLLKQRGRLLVCIHLVAAVLALEPAVHVLTTDWTDIGSAVTDLLKPCLPGGGAPAWPDVDHYAEECSLMGLLC